MVFLRKKWNLPSVLAVVFSALAAICAFFAVLSPGDRRMLLNNALLYFMCVCFMLPRIFGGKKK